MDQQALSDLYGITELGAIADRLGNFAPEIMDPDVIRAARSRRQVGELTLVIGAGVSSSVGILDWDGIVRRLVADTYGILQKPAASKLTDLLERRLVSNTILVRHLEQELKFKSAMRRKLRLRLYDRIDESAFAKLLNPICEHLLLPTGRNPIDSVITYNFDSLLERALRSFGCNPHLVYSPATYVNVCGQLVIYHVHGFLPHPSDHDGEVEEPLVFSEPDYHSHYLDWSHWANLLQLHHFIRRSCLFVGVSLNDPNMRRLLDAAQKYHSAPKHFAIHTTKEDPLQSALVEYDHRSFGVQVIWIDSRDKIPSVLQEIGS